jgi:hypothetical protein
MKKLTYAYAPLMIFATATHAKNRTEGGAKEIDDTIHVTQSGAQ